MGNDRLQSLDEFLEEVKADATKRRTRNENPWARSIIDVLWGRSLVTMADLTREVWQLRNGTGVNMPDAFREVVQSCLNQHTSQSVLFKGPEEEDLFFSPEGKGSGTWALHQQRAAAWLAARGHPSP